MNNLSSLKKISLSTEMMTAKQISSEYVANSDLSTIPLLSCAQLSNDIDEKIKQYQLSDIFDIKTVTLSSLRFFKVRAYFETKSKSMNFYALSGTTLLG